MNSSKYVVYKCGICHRETEILLDPRRPDPVRCNITLNCRGKFEKIGDRSVREFLFTPIVPGLSDFIPRGTNITQTAKQSKPNPITIFSADSDAVIAITGVRRTVVDGKTYFYAKDSKNENFVLEVTGEYIEPHRSNIQMVLYEISPELLTTSKYTYIINGPVQFIDGRDNSPDGKNLRFNEFNNLVIYVNGVIIEESQYDKSINNQITFTPAIYSPGTNVVEIFISHDSAKYVYEFNGPIIQIGETEKSLDNTILQFNELNQIAIYVNGELRDSSTYNRNNNNRIVFDPPINAAGKTVVEILVSQDISVSGSKPIILTFNSLTPTIPSNIDIRKMSCWGDYGATVINNEERFILYCSDLSNLRADKIYGVARFQSFATNNETRTLNPSELFILLGREPFSYRDKELYAYINGNTLVQNQSILTYKISRASGMSFLTVDESAITQTYNQIVPSRKINSITEPEVSSIGGTALEGTENLTPKYILGPI